MEDLTYNGDNPGSVRYGNFINYYQFHSAENRIKLFPKNIWNESNFFVALDIGCNTGDLTICLYKYIVENVCTNCKIIGIDIDPVLIERANENNAYNNITFKCVDFMNPEERNDVLTKYLNSLALEYTGFDSIFCFSVTMWIHLNHGDIGLQQFLREICILSNTIIIEPQPWKCYRNAVKRLKKYDKRFLHFNDLKYKTPETDIEPLILHQGFDKIKEAYETNWKRKILVFKKTS